MGCIVGRGEEEGGWRTCEGGKDTLSIYRKLKGKYTVIFTFQLCCLLLVRCLKEHVPVFFVRSSNSKETTQFRRKVTWEKGLTTEA